MGVWATVAGAKDGTKMKKSEIRCMSVVRCCRYNSCEFVLFFLFVCFKKGKIVRGLGSETFQS